MLFVEAGLPRIVGSRADLSTAIISVF